VAVLVLVAGATGLTPGRAALAVAVVGTGLWAGLRLLRAALAIHHDDEHTEPHTGDGHAAGRHPADSYAACRGAGFVGLGALAVALTAVVPLLGPRGAALWTTVGFGAVTLLYAEGTLLLPGIATQWGVLLRRAFDGIGLGVSLAFAGYLIPPVESADPATLPITMLAATGVSVVVVTVLRGRPHRPPTISCGIGAVAVLIGMAALTTVQVLGRGGIAVPLLGLPIVIGLAATADGGARRDLVAPRLEPRHPDQYLAGYPLLALPAAVGVVAAIWHLIAVGSFDTTAIVLGISMVALLVTRELLVVRDIRRYAGRLRVAEAHFRSLVAGATDLTLVLDEGLCVRWQSPAAARLFGLDDGEVVGRPFRDLIHPDDADEAQAVIEAVLAGYHRFDLHDGPPVLVNARMRDGSELWRDTESTISDQRSVPEVAALVVHVRDVGERKHLERTLHKLSWTDQLTGLANRRRLMNDLLEYRRSPGQPGSLLVIDLHGLDEINDSHGRETGDAVLIEVGRRIRALLRDGDVPARLGGDEFAVLTPDSAVLAYALATRITTVLAEPYSMPRSVVDLHTSVGLAELAGAEDSNAVLRHADLARRRARQLGRDRVEWYDPDVEVQLNRRMDLEKQLLGAADRGELDLVFQPQVGLHDQRPVGVEALLRWRHPQLGTILPGELLPIARAVGIAPEIDEWVLDAACKHLTAWQTGDDAFWLSINVSPRELLTARFPERVESTLKRYGMAPERLIVEVAEDWVAEDVPTIVASLAGLRKLGVRAALDDFGAGQASLSHLRRLPVDMLKLDATLVNSSPEPGGPAVIDVVVSLGRRLGLEIVGKGLETPEQIERATRAGCLYGQGFALGRPAPAERIEAYLESHRLG
jgi:diguanylate cyclase (GGDEF)-like protein/PAS domain S-box-containing protein